MKDKPLIGLRILWNLRKSDDRWSGGEILDPDNGKTYQCFVVVESRGRKLKIRGSSASLYLAAHSIGFATNSSGMNGRSPSSFD